MNVTIVDYNSGNISSVINSFKEVAKDKVNIEVTSDLNKIKYSDKVVLPAGKTTLSEYLILFKSEVTSIFTLSLATSLNEFITELILPEL